MNERKIRVSYTLYTPESVEHGDAAEHGWEDEEGIDCTPDDWDLEDGETPVSLAVRHLRDNGPVEPSSCPTWHRGVWYTQSDGSQNYRTGEEKQLAFHLSGFTDDEEREIYRRVTAR